MHHTRFGLNACARPNCSSGCAQVLHYRRQLALSMQREAAARGEQDALIAAANAHKQAQQVRVLIACLNQCLLHLLAFDCLPDVFLAEWARGRLQVNIGITHVDMHNRVEPGR